MRSELDSVRCAARVRSNGGLQWPRQKSSSSSAKVSNWADCRGSIGSPTGDEFSMNSETRQLIDGVPAADCDGHHSCCSG